MNETIQLMLSHKSIRKYTNQPIKKELLDKILQAGVSAPSSSFLQCTSIIRIVDDTKRKELARLSGQQPHIAQAAEFLVFCIDFYRHKKLFPDGCYGYTEQVIIRAVDTGLIGQNVLLAAQSLGIGGVYIGGIRNNPTDVCKLLNLPEQVFAIFGLCLGYPDQNPEVKPRLPLTISTHENEYHSPNLDIINNYDKDISAYYKTRTTNKKSSTWSSQIQAKLSKESRSFMQDNLKRQGFMTKA